MAAWKVMLHFVVFNVAVLWNNFLKEFAQNSRLSCSLEVGFSLR
jgi:hypothetical protein